MKGFDSKFLKIYPELPPTPLQLEEDLEQLKVLENGYRMKVSQIEIVFVIAMLFCYDSWKN
jgi:3-deoxy-manno-octulosonate cytidylyltransferase (CMP-KDO synthetase)